MQTLAWLRKNGFRPVPLHPRSKAAVSRDYADVGYKPPDDSLWQTRELNVGVVTGPENSGPVDIDLDCDEAVFFARRFLPPTPAVFGRKSKQRSHYLYRVDSSTFDKQALLDPVTNECIVEMRGDGGHQTVMPGSVHQDTGELIEWSDVAFPDVPTISSEVLQRAARKIAIATALSRHVWAPGYHNEPVKHLSGVFFYLDWNLEETVEMIEALMEWSGDDDKSRIPTVRATYRRASEGKKVSGSGVLRKQLKNDPLVDRLLDWAGSQSVNVVQEYNERYAVVNFGGKFRIAHVDVSPSDLPTFFQKDDFLNMTATDMSSSVDDKGRSIPKNKIWINSPRRRTYQSVDFLPGQEDTSPILNLWTGWAVQPKEGDCSAWLELLRKVICNDKEHADWLLHWFANILREPMNKPLTAPVIIGVEGAGKSLLLTYFSRILGKAFVTVTDDQHIHGRFNAHLANALVLHSEEALYAGDKKHAGIIRSLITDHTRIFEPKGVDARPVRNYLRLVLTSNDLYSAPVKPGDRRYCVFDMAERKISDRLMNRVLDEMNGDGPAALHHYLLTMKYDPKVPRTNIKSESLLALKGINLPPLESWWLDTLMSGQLLPDYLAWAAKEGDDGEKLDWPGVVSSVALYTAMSLRLRERSQTRNVPNETLFSFQLDKFVGLKLHRSQRQYSNPMLDDWPQQVKLMNERQSSVINMPGVEHCRAAFERHLGQKIEWPAPEAKKPKQKDKF